MKVTNHGRRPVNKHDKTVALTVRNKRFLKENRTYVQPSMVMDFYG